MSESDENRREVSTGIIGDFFSYLKSKGMIRRAYVSENAVTRNAGYESRLYSFLLDKKRNTVGAIKVVVIVPKTEVDTGAWIEIWWTRNILLHWWVKRIYDANALVYPYDILDGEIKGVLVDVGRSANRSIIKRSIDRMYKTKKKKSNRLLPRSYSGKLVMI